MIAFWKDLPEVAKALYSLALKLVTHFHETLLYVDQAETQSCPATSCSCTVQMVS